MDFDELLAFLDIDTPAELVYFEQFADLMEEPQEIPFETLNALAERMEPEVLCELVGGYFEDILKSVPDGESDLYTLLINIDTTLESLSSSSEDDAMHMFAEELYKFRSWYLFDQCVLCTNLADGTEKELTLFEALANQRAQHFTDDDFEFDFVDALDYPLDEYIVSLASLSEDGFDGDDNYSEDNDYSDTDKN